MTTRSRDGTPRSARSTSGAFRIVDLDSANGTFLNGRAGRRRTTAQRRSGAAGSHRDALQRRPRTGRQRADRTGGPARPRQCRGPVGDRPQHPRWLKARACWSACRGRRVAQGPPREPGRDVPGDPGRQPHRRHGRVAARAILQLVFESIGADRGAVLMAERRRKDRIGANWCHGSSAGGARPTPTSGMTHLAIDRRPRPADRPGGHLDRRPGRRAVRRRSNRSSITASARRSAFRSRGGTRRSACCTPTCGPRPTFSPDVKPAPATSGGSSPTTTSG